MKKTIQRVVQALVSLGILAWLLGRADLAHAGAVVADAHLGLLLAVLALMTGSRLLMPLKWKFLLDATGVDVPRWSLIRMYYSAAFVGTVLPATVGGDAVRLLLVARAGVPARAALFSILVERVAGLFVMAVLSVAGAWALSRWAAVPGLPLDKLGLLFLVVAALSLVTVVLLRRRLPGLSWPAVLLFSLLTLLEAGLLIGSAWLTLRALDLPLPAGYVLAFMPIQILVARLPISLAGWGVHEAGFVYFLGQAGLPVSVGLAVGLLHHALLVLALAPGALGLATYREAVHDPAIDART